MALIDSFLDYLRLERAYSECTVKAYRADLEAFEKYFCSLDDGLDWRTVDVDIVRGWIIKLLKDGYAVESVNRKLTSLRVLYRFLLRKNELRVNPMQKIKSLKREQKLPQFVRESDMDRLLDEVEYDDTLEGCRDKLILEMFYMTGIRLAELVGLNDEDVDATLKQIKVIGKRNKQRYVPFGDELCGLIQSYVKLKNVNFSSMELSKAFFVDSKGERIGRWKVDQVVRKNLSKVVRMKKRGPHVLRHSFATAMLNNSADISVIRDLLGHESLAATEIYTHVTFEELKKVYKQAHPRA